MTKGELISASIKLMFDNGGNKIDSTSVSESQDYQDRTANIIESINRAFSRIYQMGKQPLSSARLPDSKSVNGITKVDFGSLVGLSEFCSASYTNESIGVYDAKFDYKIIANKYIVFKSLAEGEYITIYYKSVPFKINESVNDSYTINYPDYLLSIIPYFVKADLYEEDNPQMAILSRNIFEQYLDDMPDTSSFSNNIYDVYDSWW